MGSSPAVPEKPVVVDQEEQFILQDVKKVSFGTIKSFKYIWIDPKIYNQENQKYFIQLRKKFELDTFTSLKGAINQCFSQLAQNQKVKCICAASLQDQVYRYLQNDNRVDLMLLFCQSQERANLLRSNFPKIIDACFQIADLIKSLETKKGPQVDNIPKQNILFATAEDTHLMNKYRLNFACLCPKSCELQPGKAPKNIAKKDFVNLAKNFYPDKIAEIQKFQAEFNIKEKDTFLEDYMLKHCFQTKSFIWDMIYNLPKLTTDPKILGYLRLPFYHLHKAIQANYKQLEKRPETLYFVIELNENERKNLQQNLLNFLIFTSFVKGYTTDKGAKKKMKLLPNSYLLQVKINKKQKDPQLDFGYAIMKQAEDQNVILNIYNFLRINEAGVLPRTATVLYGSLAQASQKRKDRQTRGKLDEQELNLLRNYDYFQDMAHKVDSQANVLQMSGYFLQSISVYQKKTDSLNKTKPSVKVTDKLHLNLAQAFKINQDYKNAQLQLSKITSTEIKQSAKILQAEIYLKDQKIDKMKELVKQIEGMLPQLKKTSPPQYFRAQNLCGVSKMKQSQFKEANKLFKNLIPEFKQFYDVKFEGISLLHDILRNKAICDERLSNPQQAINVLGSAKGWQKVCQGISPSLALTQTMMQHLYRSQGQMEQVKKSDEFLKLIKTTVSSRQIDYMNRSRLFADLNNSVGELKNTLNSLDQSGININFNQSKVPQKQTSNVNPIDQSSVNVNFNKSNKPNMNLDQSSVNVNFNNETKKPVYLDQSGVNVNFNKQQQQKTQKQVYLDQSAININVNKSNDKPLEKSKPDKYFEML